MPRRRAKKPSRACEIATRLPGFVLRFVALVTLTIWVGGFTFYSAVVIPVLHEALGSLETGYVTQQVTWILNGIGTVAILAGWGLLLFEQGKTSSTLSRVRLVLLTATTGTLGVLWILHYVMDARLDAGRLRGFYPLHRTYLVASTVQWFANLGLLAVVAWSSETPRLIPRAREQEPSQLSGFSFS